MDKLSGVYGKEISRFLSEFLIKKGKERSGINQWVGDVTGRLDRLSVGGKMTRGSLLILSHEMFEGNDRKNSVIVASALELFQTSVLVHDDIIDRDSVRRGLPAIHKQYQKIIPPESSGESIHFGDSMAVCAGDAGFFLLYELLSEMTAGPEVSRFIMKLVSREFARVVYGEMEDIYFGFSATTPPPDEIISCYISKTARYSFSLPLVIGAFLAGQKKEILDSLEKLGENLGLVYQIRDDELGIYGKMDLIGKPVGSDISEGKKTLLFSLLLSCCKTEDRRKLEKISGKKPLPKKDLQYVKDMIDKSGVKGKMDSIIRENMESAGNIILKLPVAPKYRAILDSLSGYISKRDK